MLLNPLDPTFLFLASSFVSVLFIDADAEAMTLTVRLPSAGDVLQYVSDPAVGVGLAELCVFLYLTRGSAALSRRRSLAMHWHLWNGVIIYTIMDGFAGGFGFVPRLTRFYGILDRRYRRDLVGTPAGPSVYEVAVARTVNATELFVYTWLSLAAAVGVATRATWHRTIEAAVLAMAAYGSLLFMAPDMLDGCLNQQPFGVADCFPPVTPFTFFFVYFGVLINWIWLGVPVWMLAVRVRRDVRAQALKKRA